MTPARALQTAVSNLGSSIPAKYSCELRRLISTHCCANTPPASSMALVKSAGHMPVQIVVSNMHRAISRKFQTWAKTVLRTLSDNRQSVRSNQARLSYHLHETLFVMFTQMQIRRAQSAFLSAREVNP